MNELSDKLELSWSEAHPLTLREAEAAVATLGAPRIPTRRVKVALCASDVDIPTGSLLTNALRRYAAAHLLETPSYPCELAGGAHCRCSAVLPALATYVTGLRAERVLTDGFLLVPNVQRASAISVDEFSTFHHRFNAWLQDILGQELRWDFRQHLTELAYHAIQNVYDHAYRKPFVSEGPIFSHVTARRISVIPSQRTDDALATYAKLLAQQPHVGYLDVTISDDGVGMAARHAQDSTIYWGDLDHERAALVSALERRESVKTTTFDTTIRGIPGLGMQAILQKVHSLNAYATLRTGRYVATIDGIIDTPYRIDSDPLGYLPGTVLNVLIPLPETSTPE